MTDLTPTNNILSTYRAFPNTVADGCTGGYPAVYAGVRGSIVNNVLSNGSVGPDTIAPVILELPKWDGQGQTGGNYDQSQCEDTYYGWTGATGPECNPGDDCIPSYNVPSLQLVSKNLINGSVNVVRPSWLLELGNSAQENMFNEELDNGCNYNAAFGDCDTNTTGTNTSRSFVYDGLLAPVYNIGYAARCSIYNNNESLRFFIVPYNQEADNHTVKGTQYFSIGSGKNPCTQVALLNFGNIVAADQTDTNDVDAVQLEANLYWVNVKLHTKNKYGNVCMKRPVSLHIEHGQDTGMNGCFTPYFAHSRNFYLGNKKTSDECNVPTYTCQLQQLPNEDAGEECISMVFVSECVDISQMGLVSDDNCNYCTSVVLIPKPKLLV